MTYIKLGILCLFFYIVFPSAGFSQSDPNQPKDRIGIAYASPAVKGWQVPGEVDGRNYEIYRDHSVRYQGGASVSLAWKEFNPVGANNTFLRQPFSAANFVNKRVRLTCFAKTENVENASFWMQMIGDEMRTMNADHMTNRPLAGTSDWQRYEIVLDVPAGSYQIVIGINLKGGGRMWVDDLRLEEVGPEVLVTSIKSPAETQAGSAKFIEQYKRKTQKPTKRSLLPSLNKTKDCRERPSIWVSKIRIQPRFRISEKIAGLRSENKDRGRDPEIC